MTTKQEKRQRNNPEYTQLLNKNANKFGDIVRKPGDIAQLRSEVAALRRDDANVKAQLGAIQAGLAALQEQFRPLLQSKGARLRRLARV